MYLYTNTVFLVHEYISLMEFCESTIFPMYPIIWVNNRYYCLQTKSSKHNYHRVWSFKHFTIQLSYIIACTLSFKTEWHSECINSRDNNCEEYGTVQFNSASWKILIHSIWLSWDTMSMSQLSWITRPTTNNDSDHNPEYCHITNQWQILKWYTTQHSYNNIPSTWLECICFRSHIHSVSNGSG